MNPFNIYIYIYIYIYTYLCIHPVGSFHLSEHSSLCSPRRSSATDGIRSIRQLSMAYLPSTAYDDVNRWRERERERERLRETRECVCVCVCVKVIRTKTCVLAHLKHSSSNRKRGTETNLTPSPGRPFSSSAHNLLIYLYNLFTHLHRRVVRLLLRPDLFLIQILGVKLPPMAEDAPWGRMGGRGVNMSVVGLGVK